MISKLQLPLVILFFAMCFNCHAQTVQKENRLLQGEVTTKNITDTVTLQYEHNLIFIPVAIHGKVRKFLLDTGAPTMISTQLQQEIKGDTLFKESFRDTHGTTDTLHVVSLNTFSIGKFGFDKMPAGILDFKKSFLTCMAIDGIIGSNLLRHLALKIDTRAGIIVLTDKQVLSQIQKHPTELKYDEQYSPLIKINPGPRTSEELLFDTGFNGLYSLSNRNYNFFKKSNRLKNTLLAEGTGSSTFGVYGLGNQEKTYLLKLKFLKINQSKLRNQIISTGSGQNSKIGSEIFKYGTVTIDYKAAKFWFEPFPEKVIHPKNNWGFEPSYSNGKPTVGRVWSNTKAEKTGMKPGQQILKVNGIGVSTFSLCDMFRDWGLLDQLEIELLENGTVLTVKLTYETFE